MVRLAVSQLVDNIKCINNLNFTDEELKAIVLQLEDKVTGFNEEKSICRCSFFGGIQLLEWKLIMI